MKELGFICSAHYKICCAIYLLFLTKNKKKFDFENSMCRIGLNELRLERNALCSKNSDQPEHSPF